MAQIYDNGLNPALPGYNQTVRGDVATPPAPVAPVTQNASTPIAADQLGQTKAIQVPSPSLDTSAADGIVAGAEQGVKTMDDYLKEETPKETEASKSYDKIFGDISTLLPELGSKRTDQAKAEQDAQIPQTKKQLAEINGLITTRLAQYNKQIQEQELAPGETPMPIVLGKQAAIRRNQAADIGLLQARALGLQGQVQAAQESVDRAIDLKYGAMEDEINLKMQQLELIQPILDKEERIHANALNKKYTEEREKLAEKKAAAKENINLAFSANIQSEYVNKGGTWFRVQDGKSYETPEELFKDAGVNSFDQMYRSGRVTDLTAERIADIDFVSQARAKYTDAGISINDDPEVVRQKIQRSRIYQRETYIAPSGGGGSGGGVLGLSNQQIDNISPLVTQFQNNEAVKEYVTIGTAINTVRGLGNSPTDDIQRIYAFAKVMDPNSVVREGEYKTVQDYATSLVQRSGLKANRVFNNDGFLTTEARNFLMNTLENRFEASGKTYQTISDETSRRINLVGNTDKGNQLLNNYGLAFTPPAQVETWSTPGIADELTQLARSKGYTDQEMRELQQQGYGPAQIRDLLK